MGDQAALQEAIQRARQLAAKITQSAPVKRPAIGTDSGPVRVTLAYEKPANSEQTKQHERSSSRDHNRNERDSREQTRNSRDYNRDNNDREPARESSRSSVTNHTASSGSMLSGNYQYQGDPTPASTRSAEEKIEIIIPHAVIGLVIGKGGENIKRIQNESGATVRVDPNTVDEKGNKLCTITGTKQAVEEAHIQVSSVIENSNTNKRPRLQTDGSDSYRMKIPAQRTGAIIGKGGETIKSIKQQSGCDIELDKGAKECGPDESVFIIRGTQDKIMKARSLIEARLAVRGRDGGGGRDNNSDYHSNRSGPKGVATGANAAPVAPHTDLPATYPTAGQQNPAEMSTTWAAYYAQYAAYMNQVGMQPGAASGMPYAGQPGLMNPIAHPVSTPTQANSQVPPLDHLQQQTSVGPADSNNPEERDYTEEWVAYYISLGRPDYAESLLSMRKAQTQQEQTPQQSQST